jgi:hypothetical protein
VKHRAGFSDYFAILNPVEIHAIEFVRKQLGLSTPIVEHELLQPPFYPIPDFEIIVVLGNFRSSEGVEFHLLFSFDNFNFLVR